jgi:phosphatidylglycerol:prolipoprotein diacylglycerol transferase
MTFSPYGFIIGLSFVLGIWNVQRLLPKSKKVSWDLGAIIIFVCAIVGARLYHLATDWHLYAGATPFELIAVWHGGLGLFGGLLGGLLGYLIWNRWQKLPWTLLQFLDAVAIALPWSQALGRQGNYFNQELFGPPTTQPWGIFIRPENRPLEYLAATHFHPLFLYEALGSIALGSLLVFLLKLNQKIGTGVFIGAYLFGYGVLRFSLEYLRLESAPGWFGLTIAQLVSLAACLAGALFVFRWFRRLQ